MRTPIEKLDKWTWFDTTQGGYPFKHSGNEGDAPSTDGRHYFIGETRMTGLFKRKEGFFQSSITGIRTPTKDELDAWFGLNRMDAQCQGYKL